MYRARLEFPNLKRAVMERQELFKARIVLIEDRASGTQLIQELRRQMNVPIIAISPENDKESRLMAQTARIDAGRVLLPEQAHWKAEFLRELTTFPFAKHDDQVDSVSQFLSWQWENERNPGPSIRRL